MAALLARSGKTIWHNRQAEWHVAQREFDTGLLFCYAMQSASDGGVLPDLRLQKPDYQLSKYG